MGFKSVLGYIVHSAGTYNPAWSPAYRSQLQARDCDDEKDVRWPLPIPFEARASERGTPAADGNRGSWYSFWVRVRVSLGRGIEIAGPAPIL